MLEKFKEKYNLSFVEKLTQESDIGVYVFGGAIRDIKLGRDWNEVDLRIIYNRPLKEREEKIEELLSEYNLEGKTQIENLNLTVYRFLPLGSKTNSPIDLSLVPTIDDNLPDFTINAIFYDLRNNKEIDIYNGLDDLKRKIIRTIKKPEVQFKEEPHMIFRALKFACQLDFEIEEETLKAISENKEWVQNTFNFIKNEKEGILVELFLGNIFKGLKSNPVKYFGYLNKTGLFSEFVKFYSKESNLAKKDNFEIKVLDLGSFENNISHLLSSVINSLETEDYEKNFKSLSEILAISTPKIYSDFVVITENIKYIN